MPIIEWTRSIDARPAVLDLTCSQACATLILGVSHRGYLMRGDAHWQKPGKPSMTGLTQITAWLLRRSAMPLLRSRRPRRLLTWLRQFWRRGRQPRGRQPRGSQPRGCHQSSPAGVCQHFVSHACHACSNVGWTDIVGCIDSAENLLEKLHTKPL